MPTSVAGALAHIFLHQTVEELLPFLLGLKGQEVAEARKACLQLEGNYGRHRNEQSLMLFLTGLATYTRKEACKTGFHWPGSLAHDFFHTCAPAVGTVLRHARPAWLTEWVLERDGASLVDYWIIRWLEEQDLIAYQPERYVMFLGFQLVWKHQPASLLPLLQQDAKALQRDLPLLFDYVETIPRLDAQSAANYQAYSWVNLLVQLAASGHLDHADLRRRSLLALRRDLRRPLLTWFKALYLALQPSAAERLTDQQELVELLAHPQPLVVNFALDQLKGIWHLPGFDAAPLLLHAEGLVMRPALKTGLRTLLGGFSWLIKREPAAVGCCCVGLLASPDAEAQTKAAGLLRQLLRAETSPLSAADTAAVVASIGLYADLLPTAARTALAPWLTTQETGAESMETGRYEPRTELVPELSAATALVPVRDWHELLFLTGQVLRHDDPVALERWLDGLLRLQPAFPADLPTVLGPYVQELDYLVDTYFERELLQPPLREPVISALNPVSRLHLFGHCGLVQGWFLSWAGGFAARRVAEARLENSSFRGIDPLVHVEARRLQLVERRLEQQQRLPLLSTPTHQPALLTFTTLVERLLAHESAGEEADPADLALALARLAPAAATDAAAVPILLPQLRHLALRQLLAWLLLPAGTPLPVADLRPVPTIPRSLADYLPELWAVAARTRWPQGHFPELAALLPELPEVVRPAEMSWMVEEKSYSTAPTWRAARPNEVNQSAEITLNLAGSWAPLPAASTPCTRWRTGRPR